MIQAISLDKYYRLLNIGPTVLVSSKHEEKENVMAAAWAGIVDFYPTPKVSVILDKSSYTRELIEKSGYFALQIPVARQAEMVLALGEISGKTHPDKLRTCKTELFYREHDNIPLVKGCAGWILCERLPQTDNEQQHDLFIGKVIACYADDEIFDGHWKFETADKGWRTLHYVAGGHFYTIGDPLIVEKN
ncbi:flavin reductase family protein [Basilea psittacipulmonis]|uniref:Flavin reductase n=1 Tax=Basilea psittacipulmonis DSM 24701 TaxID=1072685 RepID=A0A077DFJ7_9BURK|nr:flavin reductase family protein [Basilea psittacipulmonis]AIL32941.1 flavin reductase [Basilea psittacipulmonis DSM 24701]